MPDEITTEGEGPDTDEAGGSSRFAGRREFHAALLAMLERAVKESWMEMVMSDPDFSDWPLGAQAIELIVHSAQPDLDALLIHTRERSGTEGRVVRSGPETGVSPINLLHQLEFQC